jgi:DNA mismatch endonuclease (patch repair protein)
MKKRPYAGDTLTPRERSERMRRVPARNTKPELIVRRLIFGMGHRYRLHSRRLPGHPDIVFARHRKVIFVHGCFWHRHKNCHLARLPKSRSEFWVPKLEGNRARDLRKQKQLKKLGWRTLVVWECQLTDTPALVSRLRRFLDED